MQVVINGRKGHTIIVKYVVKRLSNAKGDNFVKGKHELFPIPLGELQANPALNNQNNPGYE